MQITTIQPRQYAAVDQLLKAAFSATDHGYDGEAELVAAIRQDPSYQAYLEVVAVENEQVVGTGLLSDITISNDTTTTSGVALAPLAVLPDHQKRGIGKKILTKLEQRARIAGYAYISVLGWPDYYSQFSYRPADQFDIQAPFDVPSDSYLIKPLTPTSLSGVTGTVQYLPAFNA